MRYQRDGGLFGMLVVFEGKTDIHERLGDFIDQPERKTLAVRMIKESNIGMGKALPNRFCLPDGSNVPKQFKKVFFQINGKSISPRVAHTSASNESHTQFYVVPGKRYRFRILDADISDLFIMSIDHHKMKIIATDGYLVHPFTTDYLILHVAERYDFILEAKKDVPIGSKYPIRIKTLAVECKDVTKVAGEGFAYIVYTNKTGKEPRPVSFKTRLKKQPNRCSNESDPCKVFNCPFNIMPDHFSQHGTYMKCYNILSLNLLYPSTYYHIPDSVEKENEYFLNYRAIRDGPDMINGIKFIPPEKPILESKVENECPYPVNCTVSGEKNCTHTLYLRNFTHATRFVYSSIIPHHQKGINVTHPIHMHGHSYFIAKIGYPEYYRNGTIKAPNTDLHIPDCGPASWKNGTPSGIHVGGTTVRKDTVIVPAGGYVAIHFFQNDPGWWFMHCHIDYHLNGGMAIAVAENYQRASTPPEQLFTDTNNFCFTLQEFLDKEFSMALSYKVGPIPNQICHDNSSSPSPPHTKSQAISVQPTKFQKGKFSAPLPPPKSPLLPRWQHGWQWNNEDTYTQWNNEDTYTH